MGYTLNLSLKCVSIGSGNISRSFCNGYIFVYQKGVHYNEYHER
nr:MAG TPA: hypothetical protein [Caudoviricetes sp.]